MYFVTQQKRRLQNSISSYHGRKHLMKEVRINTNNRHPCSNGCVFASTRPCDKTQDGAHSIATSALTDPSEHRMPSIIAPSKGVTSCLNVLKATNPADTERVRIQCAMHCCHVYVHVHTLWHTLWCLKGRAKKEHLISLNFALPFAFYSCIIFLQNLAGLSSFLSSGDAKELSQNINRNAPLNVARDSQSDDRPVSVGALLCDSWSHKKPN